jgi:nuclear pore complex protein Nup88
VPSLGVEGDSALIKRSMPRSSFEQHIRQLLRRSSSNPIIRASKGTEHSLTETLQLLTRSTQILRVEYISRQELARMEIERRVHKLKDMKAHQVTEVDQLTRVTEQVTARAHNLAEKYEEAEEKQNQLISRIESVLQRVQRQVPVVSDAERRMLKDLCDIDNKLDDLRTSLDQVKLKAQYKEKRHPEQQGKTSDSSPGLGNNQIRQLHDSLTKQGASIQSLMKKITNLKKDPSMQ